MTIVKELTVIKELIRIVIGPILTGYTHSSQVDYAAYKLFTTIVINCQMSIVFLLFLYDLGTLLFSLFSFFATIRGNNYTQESIT